MTAPATGKPPAVPVPAATLLLLRDGARGLEILMTVRHSGFSFGAGAMVFPGGKLEAGDRELLRRCAGAAGADDAALELRVAAIRETFEECGILLARKRGGAALLPESAVKELRRRHAGGADFAAMVEEAGLELAGDLLVPFAHWITPVTSPRRFDTLFFIAPAPPDQLASHDGREAVEVTWTTPESAIADGDVGRRHLMFATYVNLLKLARYRTSAEAIAAAPRGPLVTVTPELVEAPEGQEFRIPAAAGYGLTSLPARKVRRP